MPTLWGAGYGFGDVGLWEVEIARAVVGDLFEHHRTIFWSAYPFTEPWTDREDAAMRGSQLQVCSS